MSNKVLETIGEPS